MFSQLLNFFDKRNITYLLADNGVTAALVNVKATNIDFRLISEVDIVQNRIMFFSIFPYQLPQESYPEVTEFITAVNAGRFLGNFELYYGNGELRYKTSLDYTDGEVSEAMIEKLFNVPITMLDIFAPFIDKVAKKEITPLDAYTESTQNQQAQQQPAQ